jgi:hypothetical protein
MSLFLKLALSRTILYGIQYFNQGFPLHELEQTEDNEALKLRIEWVFEYICELEALWKMQGSRERRSMTDRDNTSFCYTHL